jgi:hypothetical protein
MAGFGGGQKKKSSLHGISVRAVPCHKRPAASIDIRKCPKRLAETLTVAVMGRYEKGKMTSSCYGATMKFDVWKSEKRAMCSCGMMIHGGRMAGFSSGGRKN